MIQNKKDESSCGGGRKARRCGEGVEAVVETVLGLKGRWCGSCGSVGTEVCGGVGSVGKDERGWWCWGPAGGSPSLSLV